MDYRNLLDEIEQAGSFHIEHLAFIALDLEARSEALEEIISDISDKEFKRLFPDIADREWFKGLGGFEKYEITQLLLDFDKLGFIAEIGVHQKDRFSFNEDGSFSSCSVHPGLSYVTYAYGDTIEELVENIKERCDHYQAIDIEKHKAAKNGN